MIESERPGGDDFTIEPGDAEPQPGVDAPEPEEPDPEHVVEEKEDETPP